VTGEHRICDIARNPSRCDYTVQLLMDWQAFWLTMWLALSVTALLLIIGFPLAYWIAFSKWRWKFLVEAMVGLPIVLPPTVLGFYVLIALGQRSTLAFTFTGLLIGSVLYSLPFAVQPLAASFSGVDSRLLAASAVLGVSKLRTFWRVIVPLSISGVVTAMALSFAHTMGEFGVVLMVGGNIPGVTRTLSINIYDQVQDLNYSAANNTALVLVAIAFVLLSLVYSSNRKLWKVWPRL